MEDFFVDVPLDYDDRSRGNIAVFYRILTAGRQQSKTWPLLVYLEGGPGYEAPRPLHVGSGWIGRALKVCLSDNLHNDHASQSTLTIGVSSTIG